MSGFGQHPLAVDAVRRAITEGQVDDANAMTARCERASLDEEELREVERSEYYTTAEPTGGTDAQAATATEQRAATPTATGGRRPGFLQRLFRRGS
jgi:hypothetical protein